MTPRNYLTLVCETCSGREPRCQECIASTIRYARPGAAAVGRRWAEQLLGQRKPWPTDDELHLTLTDLVDRSGVYRREPIVLALFVEVARSSAFETYDRGLGWDRVGLYWEGVRGSAMKIAMQRGTSWGLAVRSVVEGNWPFYSQSPKVRGIAHRKVFDLRARHVAITEHEDLYRLGYYCARAARAAYLGFDPVVESFTGEQLELIKLGSYNAIAPDALRIRSRQF